VTARRDLTIFVNSTDGFEDCWEPFFTLFAHYWPTCPYPVVLGSETKRFERQVPHVRSTRIGLEDNDHKLSWGECTIRSLDVINTPYLLYLQEDYFLKGDVDAGTMEALVEIMDLEGYAHIRLGEGGDRAGWSHRPSAKYPYLWEIDRRSDYRISLQAGLWRKDRFRFYLRPDETAWQLERWGTLRARREADTFLCPNLDDPRWQGHPIFPYTPTGIVGGKWYEPAVVSLFKEHGIKVNFSARGFHRPNVWARFKQRCRSGVRKIVVRLIP
jgi:hypothetical protein